MHLGLWGLAGLSPLTRIHNVMGLGWLDFPPPPRPLTLLVPSLLGTLPCRELGGKVGLPPCPILLVSPETLVLILKVKP